MCGTFGWGGSKLQAWLNFILLDMPSVAYSQLWMDGIF